MSLNTATKLVSDVLTDVKRTFGDESGVQVTDTDITRWVNSAQREILVTNRVLKAVGTTDIIGGQGDYNLAQLNIVSIEAIFYNGAPLAFRSFNEAQEYIKSNDPTLAISGDPTMWYEWAGVISLYPVPNSNAPGALKVYYIPEPTPVVNTTDPLQVPDAYYESVVQFCLSKAYELDEDSQNSQFKLSQFANRLSALSEQESNPSQYSYPRITILDEDAWG